jgi:hypothetical protein
MSAMSLAFAGLISFVAASAQAAVVVDQSTIITATTGVGFVSSSLQNGNGLNRIQSQSVTAGKTGRLSRVDVQVIANGGTADLSLTIASGIAGEAGYSILGSFVVPRASVPNAASSFAGSLVSVDVSSLGLDVAPGTVFSIGLGALPQTSGINSFGWVFGETADGTGDNLVQSINYAGGVNKFSPAALTTWSDPTGFDRGFATYVDAVPEPGSWAMLIAGFGLTGAVMRRRRLAAV